MAAEQDSIERHIVIDAPTERVWQLISEPGWWINDGAIVAHRIERRDELAIVHDPVHGVFALRTVALDRPRYAAFRWQDDPDDVDGAPTLVELTLETLAEASVRVTVLESGFASLPVSAAQRRQRIEQHESGWTKELGLAQGVLEQRSAAQSVSG